MPRTYADRRARAAAAAAALGADVALITAQVSVRYLTGLVSSNAALLLPVDEPAVLATDSRYAGAAARDCPDIELLVERQVDPALAALAADRGYRQLAFEDRDLTVARHQALAAVAEDHLELVPVGGALDDLRMVKDEAEIALLARACAITGDAFSAVLGWVRPGVTERQFAVLLERALVDLGADAPAFPAIVASGPNGAIPHHVPGPREFEPGDLITVDCGAVFSGYNADMTRTVALGEPGDWQQELYLLVAEAQAAGVDAAVAGAQIAAVDASARDMIAAAGHGDHFGHGLGHGVGLEIHEAPAIGPGRPGTLRDRVPVTIEPGVYVPGAGGVRIEDTLVVRVGAGAAGRPQLLTTVTRELLVLLRRTAVAGRPRERRQTWPLPTTSRTA